MINSFPFFRFPFYPYPRNYSKNMYLHMGNHIPNNDKTHKNPTCNNTEIRNNQNISSPDKDNIKEKNSSKYSSIGPFTIHTDGFFNKEEPLIELSGLKLYLDDLIILSLLFFLYKEDVHDDMLFILLVLILIS